MQQFTTNCAIDDQSMHFIDQQIARLEPYLDDPDDELPIVDIMVDKGKDKKYLASVTAFMPDASIHGRAEGQTISKAMHQAFEHLRQDIDAYETDRLHRRHTAQQLFRDHLVPVAIT